MIMGCRILIAALVGLGLIAGCSSPKGPNLAAADGTVTYMGAPLAGARVLFIPEKGLVAMGTTDDKGKFTLSTGSSRGAIVGPVTVEITASTASDNGSDKNAVSKQPTSAAESEAYMKKAAEMQQAMAAGQVTQPTSAIPAKYGKAETSGLAYTIKENGDNHFAIELKP